MRGFWTRLSRRSLFSSRVTSLIKNTTEEREWERDGWWFYDASLRSRGGEWCVLRVTGCGAVTSSPGGGARAWPGAARSDSGTSNVTFDFPLSFSLLPATSPRVRHIHPVIQVFLSYNLIRVYFGLPLHSSQREWKNLKEEAWCHLV